MVSFTFVVFGNVVLFAIQILDYNFICHYTNCIIINHQFVLSYHSVAAISIVAINARIQSVSIKFAAINVITTYTTMNLLMTMIAVSGTRFTMELKQSN